jgi:serine/threonine-protein kinase
MLSAVASGAAVWAITRPEPAGPVTRVVVGLSDAEALDPVVPDLDVSLDGSVLVYRAGPDDEGRQMLWARRFQSLNGAEIASTEGAGPPAVSPSGDEVAFGVRSVLMAAPIDGSAGPRTLSEAYRFAPRWSPDGAWIYFNDDANTISRVPALGGPTEVVTSHDSTKAESAHIYVDVLPGGTSILYQSNKPTGSTVDVKDLETGEVKTLIPGSSPRYSRSGHLLFMDNGASSILLAAPFDAEGLEVTGPAVPVAEGVLPNPGGSAFYAIAATGSLVYVASGMREVEGVWLSRSGVDDVVDPTWRFDTGADRLGIASREQQSAWRLSPDGSRVAVTRAQSNNVDIWIKELPVGPFTRVTFDEAAESMPFWSPDGVWVAYRRSGEVWRTRADGTGTPERLVTGGGNHANGEWPIDGLIVLGSRTGTSFATDDLVSFRPGIDSVVAPLIATEFQETRPAISSDGRWLAYQSNESGRAEVYVRPLADVNGRRVPISRDGGTRPRWARSGRELFYMDANRGINVASLEYFSELRVQSVSLLFTLAPEYAVSFDVDAEGERFLVARSLDSGASGPRLVLVQNFFEELGRLAPN